MGTFIVTRPSIDAGPVVARLNTLGHGAVLAPMLTIRFGDNVAVPEAGYQAVLLTSANGARALARQAISAGLKETLALAVGKASAAAARAAGFQHVVEADGDVSGLIAAATAQLRPKAGPLLHVSGVNVTGDMAGDLSAAGFSVHRAVLYEAVAATELPAAARAAIEAGDADGVLLYSPRTARIWCRLIRATGLAERLVAINHYCLSANVVAALKEEGGGAVPALVAAAPEEDHLFRLIAEGPG